MAELWSDDYFVQPHDPLRPYYGKATLIFVGVVLLSGIIANITKLGLWPGILHRLGWCLLLIGGIAFLIAMCAIAIIMIAATLHRLDG